MTPTFTGELQLAGWSESHTGGCKVTFWLQSPDELTAFRALTVRKGNTAGHRFMAALVEIGDDELPVEPVAEPKPREQLGDACYWTVMRCHEPNFWDFMDEKEWGNEVDSKFVYNKDVAAWAVKLICNITSRKELDTNPEANKIWHSEIRIPYMEYLKRMEAA